MFHTGSRAVFACLLVGTWFFGCAAPIDEGTATEEEPMVASSWTFSVVQRTTPSQLTGTASPSSSFKLQVLTLTKAGSDHSIKKSATADRITVTVAQFNDLTTRSIPFVMTFTGTEPGDGTFTVQSIVVN